ncbi:hypothetical protein SKAU_G00297590 [Synaphobranchus kaupii]|uniref:Uncharacterized protein n=1 Tax=Synaphobranchus kaupii TaxID=118154 RepID=A0A9Q1IMZ4_SYNKA|nr:hypothetical protein SKAU_G00297590 [Synaphobranchus kaupii]
MRAWHLGCFSGVHLHPLDVFLKASAVKEAGAPWFTCTPLPSSLTRHHGPQKNVKAAGCLSAVSWDRITSGKRRIPLDTADEHTHVNHPSIVVVTDVRT